MINNICNNKNIMVIAPHNDDELIGLGGTLLKLMDIANSISIVYLSSNKKRLEESKKILSKLSTNINIESFDGEDGFLRDSYKELVLKTTEFIQKNKVDIIFTPHKEDNHPDHKVANGIAIDAADKAKFWELDNATPYKASCILEYEVWTLINTPSLMVDISEKMGKKKEMILEYFSQMDYRYDEHVEAINKFRGLLYFKKGYAEVFNMRGV